MYLRLCLGALLSLLTACTPDPPSDPIAAFVGPPEPFPVVTITSRYLVMLTYGSFDKTLAGWQGTALAPGARVLRSYLIGGSGVPFDAEVVGPLLDHDLAAQLGQVGVGAGPGLDGPAEQHDPVGQDPEVPGPALGQGHALVEA